MIHVAVLAQAVNECAVLLLTRECHAYNMFAAYQILLSCGGNPWVAALQNSTETLEQLDHAFDNIKRKLFNELHDIVRQQVFPAHSSKQSELKLSDGSGGDTGSESGEESSNSIDEASQGSTAMLGR